MFHCTRKNPSNDFFDPSPSSIPFSKRNFVQQEGKGHVIITENEDKTVKLVYKAVKHTDECGVACTSELDPSEGCFWKVNIDSIQEGPYFYLGILGNLSLKYYIPNDATSFGWESGCREWVKGEFSRNVETKFKSGECLYFHFKPNKLSMHSIRTNKTFAINGIDTNARKYYFHISFVHAGTTVTLGPLNAEERKAFTDTE